MVLLDAEINEPSNNAIPRRSRIKSGFSILFRALTAYVALYMLCAAALYPQKFSQHKISFEESVRILSEELSLSMGHPNDKAATGLLREFSKRDYVNSVIYTSNYELMPNLSFGASHDDDWGLTRPIYNLSEDKIYGELEINYRPINYVDQLKAFSHIFMHAFGITILLLFFHVWQNVRRTRLQKLLLPITHEVAAVEGVDDFKKANLLTKSYSERHRKKIDRLSTIIDDIRTLHLSSFDNVGTAIVVVDIDGRIVRANDAFVHQFAPTVNPLEGRLFYQFLSPASGEKFVETLESVDVNKPTKRMTTNIAVDGEEEHLPATLSISYDTLAKERIIVVENKAEIFVLRNRLESALAYDLNTSLLKKRGLIENIGGLLKILDGNRMRVGVVVFKLGSLSRIRDLYGVDTAERLMQGLADITRQKVTPDATIGLLSDNELVIVLHSSRGNIRTEMLRAMTPIKQYLCEVLYIRKRPIHVIHTLGLAIWPESGSNAEELLRRASISSTSWSLDEPLSRIEYSEQNKYNDDSASIKTVLTNAIAEGRIEFDLQPIYGMKTDTVSMYELLVRLVTQDGVRIMPRDFLATAEQMGLMGDIAQFMVNTACDVFGRNDNDSDLFMLTMNLSVSQLLLPDLLDILLPLRPYRSRVVLEVSANNEVYHTKVTSVLKSLVETGFTVAADDIDATDTNLVKLAQLPVQIIKLDKVFFKLLEDEERKDGVYDYLKRVRNINKKLIIENIESEEELQIARDLNLDYAQGYYLGRPHDAKQGTNLTESRDKSLKKLKISNSAR